MSHIAADQIEVMKEVKRVQSALVIPPKPLLELVEQASSGAGPGRAEAFRLIAYALRKRETSNLTPEIIDSKILPVFAAALKDSDADIRWAAAGAASGLGKQGASLAPALIHLLKEPVPEKRWRANVVGSLALIGAGQEDVTRNFISLLGDWDVGVRCNAARGLKNCGKEASEAIPALTRLSDDPDYYTRANAAIALWHIKQQVPPPELMTQITDFDNTFLQLEFLKIYDQLQTNSKPIITAIQTLTTKGTPEARQASRLLLAKMER